jgi:hypothetical protein
VKSIEDRLRDTFRADAETVRPETLRGLPKRRMRPARGTARRAARRHAWRQAVIPLAAAAAVVVILLGATVAAPRLFPGHGTPTIASGPLPPFYLGTRDGAELEVNNAATGQIVTQAPQPRKGAVLWIATATGRLTFLVAFVSRQEQQKCTGQVWLYRLRLTPAGQPLPMRLVATTTLHGLLTSMSRDGQVLATMSNGCNANRATTLTVLNRSTQQVRHWTGPKPHEVASLSGDGSVLVYATGSGVAVLPTSAPDGNLASRSRIVAPDREFGHGTVASHLRLAPNNTLYFATHRGNNGWQLRAYNLTTGRTRLLKDLPGSPLGIVSDPSGRYLLLRYGLNRVQPGHPGAPAARLVRLDTTTGKITRLAAHASGQDQFVGEAVLAW